MICMQKEKGDWNSQRGCCWTLRRWLLETYGNNMSTISSRTLATLLFRRFEKWPLFIAVIFDNEQKEHSEDRHTHGIIWDDLWTLGFRNCICRLHMDHTCVSSLCRCLSSTNMCAFVRDAQFLTIHYSDSKKNTSTVTPRSWPRWLINCKEALYSDFATFLYHLFAHTDTVCCATFCTILCQ